MHKVQPPAAIIGAQFLLLLSGLFNIAPLQAQSITAAPDGTGTNITTPNGQTFNIQGGTLSRDGANLFHSFTDFGLSSNQVVNFLSNPQIQNILGRITGGNPSIVNGLIQVTGGNSHLYLMNPSGFVFGQNVILNVPASFTATTANGIGFNGSWFNALGTNNYQDLIGSPNQFAFTMTQPGNIINGGNLKVSPGQNITLLGGKVINTGNIDAPGGNITIAAIPGENLVRISQAGSLLSLEIATTTGSNDNSLPTAAGISPLTLPQLLAGAGDVGNATRVVVDPNGTVRLVNDTSIYDPITGSWRLADRLIPASAGNFIAAGYLDTSSQNGGGAIAISAPAGNITARYLNSASGGAGTGGSITLNAGGAIDATNSILSSDSYGGNGGNVNLTAAGNIKTGEISTHAELDSVDAKVQGGKINLNAGGAIDTSNGGLYSATYNGNGGDITLTARQDIKTARIDASSTARGNGGKITLNAGGAIDTTGEWNSIASNAWRGGNGGDITLNATGNIKAADLVAEAWNGGNGGKIALNTGGTIDTTQAILSTYAVNGNGGDISLAANGNINTSFIDSYSEGNQRFKGGDLRISSLNGSINTTADLMFEPVIPTNADVTSANIANTFRGSASANLNSYSYTGTGGSITLAAKGDITTSHISSSGEINSGNVSATSREGNVRSNVIFSTTKTGASGTVNVITNGNININHIASYSAQGKGGNVNLNAKDSVNINNIASFGNLGSGNVNIQSGSSTITTGDVQTLAPSGSSGNIALNTFSAQGNILSANLRTIGDTNSGIINVTAPDGSVITQDLNSTATTGNSGDITVVGGNGVKTGNISSIAGDSSGDININSANGGINTQNITSAAQTGTAGSINLDGKSDVNTGNVTSTGRSSGDINITSRNGNIRTGTLHTDTGKIRLSSPLIDAAKVSLSTTLNDSDETIAQLEESRDSEFKQYLGKNTPSTPVNAATIRQTLVDIQQKTGNRSAVVYVNLPSENQQKQQAFEVKLVVITPEGKAISTTVPGVERGKLLQAIQDFRAKIATSYRRGNHSYLPLAQQLYQWLIAPIEPQLKDNSINTLLFSMDSGMRTLPIAALHDGKQFLVEKYSLGMIPSFGLINPQYKTLEKAKALVMGASVFEKQDPLPAVPVELAAINQMWKGQVFLNENFIRFNLVEPRWGNQYDILHLATHAEFNPGAAENSYIQLWNDKLRLSQMAELGWKKAAVELLTLSACRTAIDNKEAELGFAGLTVATGVKSALASIWSVSDEGTFALMTEFYHQLRSQKVKSEALRLAQLAMIRGKITIESGELRGSGLRGGVALPAELKNVTNTNLAHPYFWSSFTMIGSPW